VTMPNAGGLADEPFLSLRMELVEPACERPGYRISQRFYGRSQTLAMAQIMIGSGFLLIG